MAATIDERFNDTYAKSGMQPSVGYRPPMRSVEVDYQEPLQPFTRRQSDIIAPVPDEREEAPSTQTLRQGNIEGTRLSENARQSVTTFVQKKLVKHSKLTKLPSAVKKTRDSAAYARATRVNVSILSWGAQAWFWLQLPLAILSLVFLAMSASVEGIRATFEKSPVGSFVVNGAQVAYDTINKLSQIVLGFDFNILNPLNFALLTHMLVFFIGIATLITISIIYLMSRIHPFFGKGASLKIATFIIALAGYSFPFLNLFPWALFWVLAVWRYPK